MEEQKADLLAEYIEFIYGYGDPANISKSEIEKKMKCEVRDMFSRQRLADLAKRNLGEDFKKAIALYFDRFQTKDGVNHHLLLKDLEKHEDTLTLHLKKDAVRYLKLMARVMSIVDDKPKGLLI